MTTTDDGRPRHEKIHLASRLGELDIQSFDFLILAVLFNTHFVLSHFIPSRNQAQDLHISHLRSILMDHGDQLPTVDYDSDSKSSHKSLFSRVFGS